MSVVRNGDPDCDDFRGFRSGNAQESRRCDSGLAARGATTCRFSCSRFHRQSRESLAGSIRSRMGKRVGRWLAITFCALVWADPTWAYDASWLAKRFQLHWHALHGAGEWIRANPSRVPPQARIMTWFPWELRVTSDRTTILMPRNVRSPANSGRDSAVRSDALSMGIVRTAAIL